MLLHDVGRVLNCVARLFVGSGLLQNMRCENVSQVMRSMRQEALDRTPSGIGIIDAVTLDDSPPSLVECGRIVSSINTGRLHRLDEKRLGIFRTAKQNSTMPVDVSIKVFVEIEKVGQNQPERLLSEEG